MTDFDLAKSQLSNVNDGFTHHLGELENQLALLRNHCLSSFQRIDDLLSTLKQHNDALYSDSGSLSTGDNPILLPIKGQTGNDAIPPRWTPIPAKDTDTTISGRRIEKQWDGTHEHELDGIIRYLQETKIPGVNLDTAGVVTVTAMATWPNQPQWALKNILDFNSAAHCKTKDTRYHWLILDFHGYHVRPSAYTIQSPHEPIYLKSWRIDGANEDEEWIKLHEVTDCRDLMGMDTKHTFTIENPRAADCRYIRLTLTAPTHSQYWTIALRAFEIFGTLIEPTP
jgi:hypothetical protein